MSRWELSSVFVLITSCLVRGSDEEVLRSPETNNIQLEKKSHLPLDPKLEPVPSPSQELTKPPEKEEVIRVKLGGNAQIDSTWLIAPNSAYQLPKNGGTSGIGGASATFLRRVRLRASGDFLDIFDFLVEYDFANASNENNGLQPPSFGNIAGQPAPTSIWMQVRDVPYLGDIRFGNLLKPIGLSGNTASTHLPFMERPETMDAFYGPFDAGHSLGISARNRTADERATWQYGIYRPSTNVFGVALEKFAWGGRVTWLPVYDANGEKLVHLGFGTLNGQLPQNELRVRSRPLLRNGPGYANPILVDTGNIYGNLQYTLAPEIAAVSGPWTFQAEWAGQFFTNALPKNLGNVGTIFYHGGSAEVLYFLTGETQPYDKENGVMGRVIPKQILRVKSGDGCPRGNGAWQIGARLSYLDLNDRVVRGGTLYGLTCGLNWFWNPNMKIQLNYILERRDQPGVEAAWINGIGLRAAFDF
jgi:phosphate-selective porin OprO and OprP